MLKVTVGPIHCCMSFYPCLYREDLILVLFYTNIFSFPRLRPSEDHSTVDPVLNEQRIKRMSGSIFASNVSPDIYCELTVKRIH